jgi:zinc protease
LRLNKKNRPMNLRSLLFSALTACTCLQGFSQTVLPENFFYTQLENGLEVLVIEDHNVPLVTIELAVHNGSMCEDSAFSGLSHLYEHMFFKANEAYPSQEAYLARVNELGIVFNGTTSTERVNYFITLEKSNWQEGLKFMNSAIRYPLFLQEEMTRENPVVDAEFQRNESNPYFHLFDEMDRKLWGDLYCRKKPIGDHDVILSATPEKMRIIKERYYYPDNTIIVFAGDIDHDQAVNMTRAIMGDWKPAGFDPFSQWPLPEFAPLESSHQFVVENAHAQVPMFLIGWIGPNTRHDVEATYAADVFSYILAQQQSQLQQALVETGLAFQVQVTYATQKMAGPINIIMVPNPATMQQVYDELMHQVSLWSSPDYFTDEQMQIAKDLLAVEDAYGREQTSSYIHTVTYWWASATIDYYTTYIDKIQRVTRQDIQNYISRYIQGRPYIAGLLVQPDMRTMLNTDAFFTYTAKPNGFKVMFDESSAVLTEAAKQHLNTVVQWMRINPQARIKVQGYADKTENQKVKDAQYLNLLASYADINIYTEQKRKKKSIPLSLVRSVVLMDYLVSNGIDRSRIIGGAHVSEGKTEAEVNANYRAEISITY